ncbi:hypothetical protein B0H16DRAFT_1693235 [Mycena metata]|uniref:Uncharacterized protein n=1 Tax=Mycena metata TaxID=1033252 RepID=A0AAD7N3V4_9AGAR|nr:hypothetical protein B0H16DRAFT_1693235 [Mycena metata]
MSTRPVCASPSQRRFEMQQRILRSSLRLRLPTITTTQPSSRLSRTRSAQPRIRVSWRVRLGILYVLLVLAATPALRTASSRARWYFVPPSYIGGEPVTAGTQSRACAMKHSNDSRIVASTDLGAGFNCTAQFRLGYRAQVCRSLQSYQYLINITKGFRRKAIHVPTRCGLKACFTSPFLNGSFCFGEKLWNPEESSLFTSCARTTHLAHQETVEKVQSGRATSATRLDGVWIAREFPDNFLAIQPTLPGNPNSALDHDAAGAVAEPNPNPPRPPRKTSRASVMKIICPLLRSIPGGKFLNLCAPNSGNLLVEAASGNACRLGYSKLITGVALPLRGMVNAWEKVSSTARLLIQTSRMYTVHDLRSRRRGDGEHSRSRASLHAVLQWSEQTARGGRDRLMLLEQAGKPDKFQTASTSPLPQLSLPTRLASTVEQSACVLDGVTVLVKGPCTSFMHLASPGTSRFLPSTISLNATTTQPKTETMLVLPKSIYSPQHHHKVINHSLKRMASSKSFLLFLHREELALSGEEDEECNVSEDTIAEDTLAEAAAAKSDATARLRNRAVYAVLGVKERQVVSMDVLGESRRQGSSMIFAALGRIFIVAIRARAAAADGAAQKPPRSQPGMD